MANKKDYILECGWEMCDGGTGCKETNNPPSTICKGCFCFKCTRGKCQTEELNATD